MEFQSQENPKELETRTINFLKEDSSKFLMPESNEPQLIWGEGDKNKIVDLLKNKNEVTLDEMDISNPKNENKVDVYDAVTKSSGELEAMKEESFFEELQRDEEAGESRFEVESNIDMDDSGEMDFDFD